MINFKDRQDYLPSLVSVSSIIALLGTLIFALWSNANPLSAEPEVARAKREGAQVRDNIDRAKTRLATEEAKIEAATWVGAPQQIQTQVLNRVSAIAAKRGVKINTVRPQRTAQVDEFSTLPYLVTVEGTYPSIIAFERDIELPSNKMAVNVIQIASTDPNSDRVTASIGVVAYINPKSQTPPTNKKENPARA